MPQRSIHNFLFVMNTPSEAVLAFIAAHHAWEAAANARIRSLPGSNSPEHQSAIEVASREYSELVSRFCATSVKTQGVCYGDDGMHHPERETVESLSVAGQLAIVRTKHVGLRDFVSEYEYHLVQESAEWRVASLLYVDQDGKYECL
jgi:hypothetical protein